MRRMPKATATELSIGDKARLRAATSCDERTIMRWWRGGTVRPATAERLSAAAKALGLL
jgi:hypothetical protein